MVCCEKEVDGMKERIRKLLVIGDQQKAKEIFWSIADEVSE